MPRIIIETQIHADLETCFDAARDMRLHALTTRETGERIVAGPKDALLEPGTQVTFEARHLGIRQQLSAQITEFHRPHRFVDEMTRGIFKSLRHTHEFEPANGSTLMRDTLEWTSPLGPLGTIADYLIVRRHLTNFLQLRCTRLKQFLESSGPNTHN